MLKLPQSRELCSEMNNLHMRTVDSIFFSVINVEYGRPFCSMCCKILHERKQRSDPNPIICNSRKGWNRIKVGRAENILAQISQDKFMLLTKARHPIPRILDPYPALSRGHCCLQNQQHETQRPK